MPREKKTQIIGELQQVFSESRAGIFTDYRGLSTARMTELRRTLKNSDINYRVVKNTLARFAAERAGKKDLASFFEGPVAIAFGQGEVTELAKVLAEYIRVSKSSLSIKGGFLSDRLLTPGEVETLATLPPREILLGKVLAGMQSPIATLISCLANPVRGVMGVLQARIKQLEGA